MEFIPLNIRRSPIVILKLTLLKAIFFRLYLLNLEHLNNVMIAALYKNLYIITIIIKVQLSMEE